MSRRLLTDADRQTILDEFARQGGRGTRGSITRTAKASGWDRGTVYAVCCPHRGQTGETPEIPPISMEREEDGDGLRFKFTSDKIIETVEDAIAKVKADMTVWRVKKFACKSYQVPMRIRQGQDDKGKNLPEVPCVKSIWLVSVEFERIQPRAFDDAEKAMAGRMRDYAPKYRPVIRSVPKRPMSLVVALYDMHFGKLAWGRETGQSYDLKIAEELYRNAMDDLLDLSSPFEIERIVLPLGSDLVHIDGLDNATTAGTLQDVDSRYPKIIETAESACIWAVERAAQVADVRVIWKPGNHDRIASYHLARTVKAWFRNHPGVVVDVEPEVRKYDRWGANLIGFSHGHLEAKSAWSTLMFQERPKDIGETTCREWLLGHEHTAKTTEVVTSAAESGVMIRRVRSLSATDAWHHGKAFLANDRAAEGFLYDKERGFLGNFLARPRISA